MLGLLLLQVFVSCLWLGHSEVVPSFASCPQFFYAQKYPNDVLDPQNAVCICQSYENQYHYATLYDKQRRIPMYSAYIYHPGDSSLSPQLFAEPQLINKTYSKNMYTEETIEDLYNITIEQISESQAIKRDYKDAQGLDHGQLTPSGHQNDEESKTATFTLTNIVPLNSTLNQGDWKDYENKIMAQKTQGCDTTYVITGAVPGNTYISNGRVNVPSHIWSAACCLKGNSPIRAWGAIAKNGNHEVDSYSLGTLEALLTNLYNGKNITLFNNACPRE